MRFRFTLRDLWWLVVVICFAVGWWSDHRTLLESYARDYGRKDELAAKAKQLETISEAIRREGWTVRTNADGTLAVLPPDAVSGPRVR